MPLATTQRSGLVDQVIGQLRAAITGGEWDVGQRIPPESELATTLGVGRNTVREAVRALAHCGLLEVRQGDGTYVRATSEVSGAVRRLCGSELREVLHVRRALEVEGARLAAVERTADDLTRLSELLAERGRALREDRFDDFVRIDTEFHLTVVRCGRNSVLEQLYRGMTEVITASVATTSQLYDEGGAGVEHDGLLEAIRAGDPERAAAEAGGFLNEMLAELDRGAMGGTAG